MNLSIRTIVTLLLTGLSSLMAAGSARAHLMPAQHGTLHVVDDGAFMVVTLPISAFGGLDDDGNGAVSMLELNRHRGAVVAAVRGGIVLNDALGDAPLTGVLLSPVRDDEALDAAVSALTVLGRFELNLPVSALLLRLDLFDSSAPQQAVEFTATRDSDSRQQQFMLRPDAAVTAIFGRRSTEGDQP
jgi:hypothetical protein